LCAGAHVIQVSRFSPREWLELVQRHKVRWAYLVPTMMSRIWDLPEAERRTADLSSLEVVIHMAAPCPEWLKAAWIDWLGPERLWEVYGGTEGIGGTSIRGVEWLSHRGSVGRPAQPVQIRAEQGDELPPGEIGEICFFVDPAHPTHRLIGADPPSDMWQSYGDLGYLDSDGYLYLVDRRTDVIISGGVNLYPAEIESGLEAHPAILSAVVVGLPHRDLQAVPHAVLQVAPDARPPATDELGQFLRRRLAPHKLPRTIEYTQVALRDESGKTRRSRLRQERLDRLAAGERFLPLGSPS
jgi:bile acid-coenzyme A ligase